MNKNAFLVLSALILGVIAGSLLSTFAVHQPAAAQSGLIDIRVFRGTTDANGRASIPHDITGACETERIVGMTAAIQNTTNDAWYVPGDNEWAEGRSFMAWDNQTFTVEIDEESGWYSNQPVTIVAFVQPVIC